MYLGVHIAEIPDSDPSARYQAKSGGNSCEQRRWYIERHIEGKKPWYCPNILTPKPLESALISDIECRDELYEADGLEWMSTNFPTLSAEACRRSEERIKAFKLGISLAPVVALAVAGFLVFKILD